MELSAIFNCLNCGTIFTRYDFCYAPGIQWYEVCPNRRCLATDLEWSEMLEVDIITTFYGIIGANFDEVRRTNLRGISESMMEPYPWKR